MPDRFYGGFRAGRTQASLAVLLRRDDTNKGKTGVAPAGAVPSLVNVIPAGDDGTTSPSVLTFTPGAGSNYTVLRYRITANVKPSSVACVPTGGGTTVNLAEIGSKFSPAMGGAVGMFGGALLPGIEYTITVTWESSNANAAMTLSAYANVGSVGTPASASGTGSPTNVSTVAVATGGGAALVIDLCGAPGGTSAITPGGGQTAEQALNHDGASQTFIRGSYKVGSGSVTMTETANNAGGAIFAVALLGAAGVAMTAAYVRQGAAPVDVPLVALGSPSAAWAAGGWVELDAVKLPGLYRFDPPDAAVADGADWVAVEVVVAGAFEYVERLALETRRSLRRGATYPGLTFFLQAPDGSPKLGASVTTQRFLDGGAPATMANAVVEKSGGVYTVDLAAADTDALFGLYLFTATGATPRAVLLIFEP